MIDEKERQALERIGAGGETVRRLQAIIVAWTYSITMVAKVFQVTRATLMSWIKNFDTQSEKGMEIKPGRGRNRKILLHIKKNVRALLASNTNTTIMAVRLHIKEKYGIEVGRMTVYRLMKDLSLSHIMPRPRHYKADQEAQEAF